MSQSYLSIIPALVESSDPFPVDFDEAWQWIGFSRKDNAKRCLSENFTAGSDFLLLSKAEQSRRGGHNREHIGLTVDCFKAFCMLAQTEKGREVRAYFIDVEKRFHRLRDALPLAAEALPLPEPVETSSIPSMISGHPLLREATTAKLRAFVRLHALLAKGGGIQPRRVHDPLFGECDEWPLALLEIAARRAIRAELPETLHDPEMQEDAQKLLAELARKGGEFTFGEILALARKRRLVVPRLPGNTDFAIRSSLGKILAGLDGCEFEGHRFRARGTGRQRRYCCEGLAG